MESTIRNIEKNRIRKKRLAQVVFYVMILVAVVGMIYSVAHGAADLNFVTVTKVIISKIFAFEDIIVDVPEYVTSIVWEIRLPRILMALIVGAGLAVAGAVFQSILRNPLADPYTIGVSTGAAFGATVAIFINLFFADIPIPVMPFAFLGAVLTLLAVMKIATKNGVIASSNLIIAGIIVSSILSAGISFLKSAAGEQVAAIVFWIMGSLVAKSWIHVLTGGWIILLGILVCVLNANKLDIMSLGEKEAKSLGVDVKKTMRLYLVTASLITAACVSVGGIIGFVGLIIPHMIRFSLSSKNKVLIPLSAVSGAVLLLVADNMSRLLLQVEIPVGVITTLLGGPFFIWLFLRQKR